MEEYFEAHSSSKVLTSDRTLQKLQKRRLNQVRFIANHTTPAVFDFFEDFLGALVPRTAFCTYLCF